MQITTNTHGYLGSNTHSGLCVLIVHVLAELLRMSFMGDNPHGLGPMPIPHFPVGFTWGDQPDGALKVFLPNNNGTLTAFDSGYIFEVTQCIQGFSF